MSENTCARCGAEMAVFSPEVVEAVNTCAAIVWEHRGKCISDESAKALIEAIFSEWLSSRKHFCKQQTTQITGDE